MRPQRRFFTLKVVGLALLALAATAEARADLRGITALGADLPMPGGTFDEVKALKLESNQRLICDSDADKPKLAEPRLLELRHGRSGLHVRRCTVLAPGANGAWELSPVPTLAGPTRLWLLFVEQGGGGRYRLAQISLWAKVDAWNKVAAKLSEALGPAMAFTDSFLNWEDEQSETLMFVDRKRPGEFAVSVGDVRLRKLIRSPGPITRPE